jgi:hypothetical protein
MEASMQFRRLVLATLCGVMASVVVAPAFADEDWRWRQRQEWREREDWREREAWRERAWREQEWRERHYPPPVVAAPPPGFYAPPPAFYPPRGYYR